MIPLLNLFRRVASNLFLTYQARNDIITLSTKGGRKWIFLLN
nr:MAG TPA: hypothetical protein [Caudoviricetes sp.]